MTPESELRVLENRVRLHLEHRAAHITAATLRPPQPPVPPPGAARRLAGLRTPVLRIAVPATVAAAAGIAVLGWTFLAPGSGGSAPAPPVPPAHSGAPTPGTTTPSPLASPSAPPVDSSPPPMPTAVEMPASGLPETPPTPTGRPPVAPPTTPVASTPESSLPPERLGTAAPDTRSPPQAAVLLGTRFG